MSVVTKEITTVNTKPEKPKKTSVTAMSDVTKEITTVNTKPEKKNKKNYCYYYAQCCQRS